MVQDIGSALGRDVPFVEVSREEAEAVLARAMGEYAGWYLDGRVLLVDHPQSALTTVEEVLGDPRRHSRSGPPRMSSCSADVATGAANDRR